MSSSDDSISMSFQQASVSSAFNSKNIFILVMGMYTAVFFGTVHIYVTRKSAQKSMIIAALTALYGVVLGQFILQWYMAKVAFVDNGDTRLSIAISVLDGLPVPGIIYLALQYIGYIIADALLTWRCFYMCGHSLIRISPLLFLLVAELALAVASTTVDGRTLFQPSYDTDFRERQAVFLDGSMSTVTAVTSLLGTYIICRRIVITGSRQESASKSFYSRIMRLLIESSMLYSFSVLLNAVSSFYVAFAPDSQGLLTFELSEYLDSITSVVTGLAPTLMMARIAFAREVPTNSVSLNQSTMQFQEGETEISGTTRLHVISMPSSEHQSDASGKERKALEA
ncbi:hypothetical protein CPC08DRAFT_713043 [Agrocybe pediades]|nr:hypothetical protein CPC08DRAFT_713043 [Agrocybe pediades]